MPSTTSRPEPGCLIVRYNWPVDFTRSAGLIPETTRRDVGDEKCYLQDPFFVCTSIAEPAISPLSAASQFQYVFRGHLTLPHVVTEFKKQSDDEGKALNQGRVYLVSLVAFYSALRIDDHAFYCIVISGKIGTILMAWKLSKQDVRGSLSSAFLKLTSSQKTYLIQRNLLKFDLFVPLQAFHFATCLLRLRDDQEKLKQLVEEMLKKDSTASG
jgi:hypothetical protein